MEEVLPEVGVVTQVEKVAAMVAQAVAVPMVGPALEVGLPPLPLVTQPAVQPQVPLLVQPLEVPPMVISHLKYAVHHSWLEYPALALQYHLWLHYQAHLVIPQ